jgi:hypothetical protein
MKGLAVASMIATQTSKSESAQLAKGMKLGLISSSAAQNARTISIAPPNARRETGKHTRECALPFRKVTTSQPHRS